MKKVGVGGGGYLIREILQKIMATLTVAGGGGGVTLMCLHRSLALEAIGFHETGAMPLLFSPSSPRVTMNACCEEGTQ